MPSLSKSKRKLISRFLDSSKFSAALGSLAWLCSLPFLAHNPQTGDGAELVLTAVHGGVIHPPGFPLQAWFQRLFVLLPLGTASTRVALLSLTAHAGAVFVIAETGRLLEWDAWTRALTALLFATTVSFWYLGLQPEVFSLAYLLIAATLLAALRIFHRPSEASPRSLALVGVLFGLAVSQHLVSVVLVPCLLLLAHETWTRNSGGKLRRLGAAFAIPAILIPTALYFSLPLLAGDAVWPNWGNLDSLSALVGHFIRKEYGVFALSSHTGTREFSGVGLLLVEVVGDWGWLGVLLIPGILFCIKRQKTRVSLGILLTLLFSLIFLWKAGVVVLNYYAESILSRFLGASLLPLVLLLGIAVDSLRRSLPRKALQISFMALVSLFVLYRVPSHAHIVDLSENDTIEIFRSALFESIPEKVIAFSGTDVEVFYGVSNEAQKRTVYPIAPGLIGLDWYRLRVVPRIVSGLVPPKTWGPGAMDSLIQLIWKNGLGVACLQPENIGIPSSRAERRGLIFAAWGPFGGFSQESSESVVRLCKSVKRLHAIPEHGRPIDKALFELFVDAFLDAARYHQSKRQTALAERFWSVARALSEGTDANSWRSQCDLLEREAHASH